MGRVRDGLAALWGGGLASTARFLRYSYWPRLFVNCIFCGIVEGRLPAERFYEDEAVLGFMDIRPLVPGHALLIPKAHCLDLRDCPEEALGPLLSAAKKAAAPLVEAVGADGFNLIVANGKAAGQEVFHLHLHLLPRKKGDGFSRRSLADSRSASVTATHEQLRPVAEKVRSLMAVKS